MTSARVTGQINLKGVRAHVHAGAAKGLFLGAEHVLQVSNKSVPIEEDTLERSGHASVDAAALEAAISYDTPYAVEQHENLDLHHDQGRSAKFLENAANSERRTVRELISREIRKSIGTA